MKNLFFAALVAVVAVGSAYAQEYSTGPNSTGTKFSCNGTATPICRTHAPSGPIYLYGTDQEVILSTAELDRTYTQF